jgi:hypothetical protein
MPQKKVKGVGRIGLRCEPWFADLVADAAEKMGSGLSSYVRRAIIEQMRRDGISPEPITNVSTAKPRGRPPKKPGFRAGD